MAAQRRRAPRGRRLPRYQLCAIRSPPSRSVDVGGARGCCAVFRGKIASAPARFLRAPAQTPCRPRNDRNPGKKPPFRGPVGRPLSIFRTGVHAAASVRDVYTYVCLRPYRTRARAPRFLRAVHRGISCILVQCPTGVSFGANVVFKLFAFFVVSLRPCRRSDPDSRGARNTYRQDRGCVAHRFLNFLPERASPYQQPRHGNSPGPRTEPTRRAALRRARVFCTPV